jgi:hypothetical protein
VRALRNLLAGGAALIALSLSATACDTSPYAARVNSQTIRQTALNVELREWSSSRDYVNAVDSSTSSGGVTVSGQAPGTYSTKWVSGVLGGMIAATIFRQQLDATGQVPSPGVDAAANSVNAISQIGWDQFSPEFRQTLVARLSDESLLTPPSVPASTLRPVYDRYAPYFFNQICTVQSSAFSKAEADAIQASGVPNGHPECYDQDAFTAQPASFQNAVLGVAVGKTAPLIPTLYGYLVVKVVSRTDQGFTADVQRVLSTAVLSAQGSPNPTLNALVAKAHVQVNPAYGSWQSSQIVPPAAPSAGT